MILSGEPSTPRERALHLSRLFTDNRFSDAIQCIALIESTLTKWSRTDCFEAAGIADPRNNKTPREVIEPLVWYRHDGWEHGGCAETWKDRAKELDKGETSAIKAMIDIQKAVGNDDRVPIEIYQKVSEIIDAWETSE